MDDPEQLATLLASRICHDLISPVGAIGNGVELIGMSQGAVAGPELDLIGQSAAQAQARIRLFRLAFGAVRADQMIGADELRSLLDGHAQGLRHTLGWTPAGALPRPMVKLALLGLMCMETALPWGGHVACAVDAQGTRLDATAERMAITPALWDGLESGRWPDELRPAQVQFPLLRAAATAHGARLSVARGDDWVTLCAQAAPDPAIDRPACMRG